MWLKGKSNVTGYLFDFNRLHATNRSHHFFTESNDRHGDMLALRRMSQPVFPFKKKGKIEKFYIYNAPYFKDHSVAIISYTFYHTCCNLNI